MRHTAWMMLLGAAAAMPLPGAARAEDCRAIDGDLDRLACYDRQSGRTPVTARAGATGAWTVRTDTSEFRDTTDHYMSVASDEPLACNMFGTPRPATLFVRCQEDTTSLFIATDCHLASGYHGYGRVEYRIDSRPSRTREFDASTDNEALGLWSGGQAIPVLKEMLEGRQLLVRFTPFNHGPVSARFDISGIETAIAPLRAECGW
jgi:type VI secretion system protein VasI